MRTVVLSDVEAIILLRAVDAQLHELQVELVHTDLRELRQELRQDIDALERARLKLLGAPQPRDTPRAAEQPAQGSRRPA